MNTAKRFVTRLTAFMLAICVSFLSSCAPKKVEVEEYPGFEQVEETEQVEKAEQVEENEQIDDTVQVVKADQVPETVIKGIRNVRNVTRFID